MRCTFVEPALDSILFQNVIFGINSGIDGNTDLLVLWAFELHYFVLVNIDLPVGVHYVLCFEVIFKTAGIEIGSVTGSIVNV